MSEEHTQEQWDEAVNLMYSPQEGWMTGLKLITIVTRLISERDAARAEIERLTIETSAILNVADDLIERPEEDVIAAVKISDFHAGSREAHNYSAGQDYYMECALDHKHDGSEGPCASQDRMDHE